MENFNDFGLSPEIRRGVDNAGFRSPFPIQEKAIGPLMQGRNLIGQAKAGSGKTLAFGIPLLESTDDSGPRVQALVLAPTRELAVQIAQELIRLAAFTDIKVVTIYGGHSMALEVDALRRGAQVVVGTPGRIVDHLKRGTVRLDSANFVVVDEADTMLDMGFIDDVDFIIQRTPPRRQISLFSATMPRSITDLARRYMTDPVSVSADPGQLSAESLEQFYARVERDDKLPLLLDILSKENRGGSVVFCRTRHGTMKLAKELGRRFLSVAQLHGDLSQNQRDHSMALFRSGKADVLVATDVASRGIDIRHVGCVVNYDVPLDPVVYFHRVGRTARAGDKGKSYIFVTRDERYEFGRILALAKAPINPLRSADSRESPIEGPRRQERRSEQFRSGTARGARSRRSRWRRYK